ncbi:MAG: hypothetical protein A2W85_08165 [Bacteroidetes bacterium GWF2_41_31]|nr:MAG: hypothetical protein A2W85_08165 [Bacteroidetes bacterium GWF2_41_31]OFZ08942.1 MAG: hypothetical protein A2338_04000 [Bacteroidetes bacterium RIFOXYB12_FULL_41_6]
MQGKFLLLLISLSFMMSFGLSANPDSIVQTYCEQANKYQESRNYDSSLMFLKLAIYFADSTKDEKSKALVYRQMANLYYDLNEFDSARIYYKKVLTIKPQPEGMQLTSDFIGLSLTYLEHGFTDSALCYITKGRQHWAQHQDSLIYTSLENNTARIYLDKGDFDLALKHFLLALDNANLNHDSINLIYVNLNIGTLYQQLGKFDNALDSYLKSLEISRLTNNTIGLALAYSIGIIYKERKDYQTALKYYTMAIPPCIELGKFDDVANIYNNMSNVYMLQKRYLDAANILRKSINLSATHGNNRQLGIAYANMGKTKELQGFYDSAIYYLDLSRAVFVELGMRNLESIALRMTSEAYEKDHDYKNALFYHKEYILVADSIRSEKVEKQIAELQLSYETEKKDKENKLLKKDIEFEKGKSHYLLLLALLLTFTGIVSLILFYFIRKSALTRKQLAESKATALEAKLEGQKRELTLGALSLSRNLEFINSLINELRELSGFVTDGGMRPLNNIVKKLGQQQSNSSWKEFEKRFSEIHSNFYSRLLEEYPTLTQSEVKLCAFLKLGMNTKEICSLTFQSVRAVEASRLRLRKKLNIASCENLSMFLQKY